MQRLTKSHVSAKTLTVVLLASSILLSACGPREEEGDGDSQPIFNANGDLIRGGDGSIPLVSEISPSDQLSVRVISDVSSIATGGSDVATITALVTDANRNAVADTEVTFSSTAGVLQNISSTTDANGEAYATLNLLHDFQNQDAVVSVSTDDHESSVKVTASGSVLDVAGPENLIIGDTAQLVVRLIAGNGEPIANQAIEVNSQAGNSVMPAELITDTDGRVDVTIGSEFSSDTLRITALNGTVSAIHNFDVVEDLLSFTDTAEGAELVVGAERVVSVNWVSLGQAVVGQALRFTITAGTIAGSSTVTTDSQGNASVSVFSTSSGPAKITVQAASAAAPQTDIDVEFVATSPNAVRIDASASLVNVNETSTLTAFVTDALGNPVKNSVVSFSSADLKGGQLSPASAVSNSAGISTVTFTAGDSPTESDEIQVTATVDGAGIDSDSLRLSVFKRALNITLGSSNEIILKPLGTQYAMPLVVQVSDGSGTPLENATVRVSVRPLAYLKGFLELLDENRANHEEVVADGGTFEPDFWGITDYIECPAEDLDGDRILDTLGAFSEDVNNNGSLDPQDPASLVAIEGDLATLSGGSLQTDSTGSGNFELLFTASNALWAVVEVTARAEALGDEATDTFETYLAMPSSVIDNVDDVPANHVSPYGVDTTSDIERSVLVNNQLMPIYTGCTTTF